MKHFIYGMTAALSLTAAASAQEIVDGSDPAALTRIIQDYGYEATLTRDDDGNPMIESSTDGTNWAVFFYSCNDKGEACSAAQFYVGYGLDKGLPLRAVNKWNREYRFARMYVNENKNPRIEMDVNLAFGVTAENFSDTVDYWRLILETVENFLSDY